MLSYYVWHNFFKEENKMCDWANPITDYWLKYYLDKENHVCSLCGNYGIIYTNGIRDPRGIEVGRSNYCICPNGQSLRKNSEEE